MCFSIIFNGLVWFYFSLLKHFVTWLRKALHKRKIIIFIIIYGMHLNN